MTIKICNTCAWCTEKNTQEQKGKCMEPHSPRNAKGEICSWTRLETVACRRYLQAAEPVPREVTNIVHQDPAKKPAAKSKKPVQKDIIA